MVRAKTTFVYGQQPNSNRTNVGVHSTEANDSLQATSAVMPTRRLWLWGLLIALLAFLVLPEMLHSLEHRRFHKRVAREKEAVAALVHAGDGGYDELVRLLPTL